MVRKKVAIIAQKHRKKVNPENNPKSLEPGERRFQWPSLNLRIGHKFVKPLSILEFTSGFFRIIVCIIAIIDLNNLFENAFYVELGS